MGDRQIKIMSQTLKNIKIPYPNEGVVRSAQLSDTVAPTNSVQIAVNMNFDQVGAVKTRPGVATYATQQAGAISSFGTLNVLGSQPTLYVQVGTALYGYIANTFYPVRTLSVTTRARYAQYLNQIWMCNGHAGDPIMSSPGGSSNFTSANVPAGFPKADFISAGQEGRLWVADSSTDTLYYTDIVQFNGTYQPLTFTLATNFIADFSPQNGQSITGLFRVPRALLVFKQNTIFRVYGAYSVDPYPAYNVGTYSQESIVQAKDGVYFHHSSGFYKFNYSSQPTELSRRVIDFVRAIPRSYYGNVQGVWDGFDSIEWSVGPITVEGVSYSNCVMRYTISTQVWTIYDYPENNITSMIRYDNGANIQSLMGTVAGRIGSLDTGNDDFGQPIYYELIDRWRSFTPMYSRSKNLSGLMIMSENAAGARVEYQIEKSQPNVWTYIDTVDTEFDALFPNANTDDFSRVRLRLSGNTNGEPMLFYGIEVLSVQDKGLDEN